MNKIMLFFILSCFVLVDSFAQYSTKSFSACSSYVSEVMDIVWKKPKEFEWNDVGIALWSQGNRGLGSTYGATMQSKDGNSFILYPVMSFMLGAYKAYYEERPDEKKVTIARKQMMDDMHDAFKHKQGLDSLHFEWEKYVVTLVGDDAPFNADTVFIANIPLRKPYQDKYAYFTGIYIWKEGRVPMIFKCFFTEEGKKKESKFLSKFYKMVRYRRNDNWFFDEEKAAEVKYQQELKSRRRKR